MIAVTGSTGELGKLVIDSLAQKTPKSQIIAIARDRTKAQRFTDLGIDVRVANYDDPASWDEALKGVTKLLLISSSEIGKRALQHATVIDAAKSAGVSHVFYTSVLHADTSLLGLANEHRETEAALRASGIPYTLLRNGWYSENYTMVIKSALEHGAVFGAAGDGKISSAPRRDYADAAATILLSKDPRRVYELAGDQSYTLSEFASELSKVAKKPILYKNMSKGDYEALLLQIGLPAPVASLVSDSDEAASRGGAV